MPAPPRREILVARDSDPAREGARGYLPVLARGAEHACRVEGMAQDHCFSDQAPLRLAPQDRDGWTVEIGAIADIERRMGVEDLQPAHQEEREADDVDPMRDAHQPGMPAIPALGRTQIAGEDGGHIMLRRFGSAACWPHILCVPVDAKVCALSNE